VPVPVLWDDVESSHGCLKAEKSHSKSPVLVVCCSQLTGGLRHLRSGVTAVRERHLTRDAGL
jgi:hypothetical protein